MAQCIHRLIALQSKKVSKNYIWIAITAPFPVLGHSNNVWDILGRFGTSFGTWDFCIFGTFWDISGHQQNKNLRNPVRKPLRRAIDRNKLTNRTRYVRVTYGHFKTFWDIFWDMLGHFGTSVEHVYERPKFDPPASWDYAQKIRFLAGYSGV